MHPLDRRMTTRSQVALALSAVSLFTAFGGGMGYWLGKNANLLQGAPVAPMSAPASDALVSSPGARNPEDIPDANALAATLGRMQAEVMRLNALGERLVEMAGLNGEAFDFQHPPPQGGPADEQARDFTIKEIASELGSVVSLLKDRKRKLEILEEAIVGKDLTAYSLPTGWPVRAGYITSTYGFRIHPIRGRRHFHQGIDFAAPAGSPVVAVAEGRVIFSGRRKGYGNMVEILHADGYSTRYAHNTRNLVTDGQQVRRGQEIGTVGETGTATGPHVHFEVLRNGDHLNPIRFVDRQPENQFLAANAMNPR